MLFSKTTAILTASIISFASCQKKSEETVVFETTSNDLAWVSSGVMAGGQDLGRVDIDISQISSVNYNYLTVEESYAGTTWEEIPIMDLNTAISANRSTNIYTVDASRGRTIRVYNFRRRLANVTIRIRAHRR